jgi:uncharacterized phage protein (TIGR02220 family)
MRVNVDSMAFSDPRFRRLGARLHCSWHEALGRCLPIWAAAYTARSPLMERDDIDAIAERPGFADALIASGLARLEELQVWVCGVFDRCQWLIDQDAKREMAMAAKRKKAGLPKVERPVGASRGTSRGMVPEQSSGMVPGDVPREGPYSPAPTPALTLTPDPDPALDQNRDLSASQTSRGSRKRGKQTETPEELATVRMLLDKLSERSGVNYRGSVKHTSLIVARLRQGVSAWDMRRVIGYCAEKLEWQTKPNMQPYLRPETLFGPETIERYLDQARAWEPGPAPEEETAQSPPMLRLVDPVEARRNAETLTGPEWEEPAWMTTKNA